MGGYLTVQNMDRLTKADFSSLQSVPGVQPTYGEVLVFDNNPVLREIDLSSLTYMAIGVAQPGYGWSSLAQHDQGFKIANCPNLQKVFVNPDLASVPDRLMNWCLQSGKCFFRGTFAPTP